MSDIIPLFMTHRVAMVEQKSSISHTEAELSRNDLSQIKRQTTDKVNVTDDTCFNSKNYQVAMENEVVDISNTGLARK